jgi:hypothetical protein
MPFRCYWADVLPGGEAWAFANFGRAKSEPSSFGGTALDHVAGSSGKSVNSSNTAAAQTMGFIA